MICVILLREMIYSLAPREIEKLDLEDFVIFLSCHRQSSRDLDAREVVDTWGDIRIELEQQSSQSSSNQSPTHLSFVSTTSMSIILTVSGGIKAAATILPSSTRKL